MKYLSLLVAILFITSCSNQNNVKDVANNKVDLTIDGMMCSMGCVASIKKKLASVEGVVEYEVEFEDKKASIVYNPSKTNTENIVKSIENLHSGMYKVVNVKELGKESKKTNEVKDNSKLTDKEIQHEIKDFHFKIPNIFSILYNLINKI
jgi:copper chaperone CopZ